MSMQDPISDMVTRIKNAQMAKFNQVTMPGSKMKLEIARVLKEQGYIADYKAHIEEKKQILDIKLKYFENKPVIAEIKRCSRPGLRVYKQFNELPTVKGGLGVAVISTSKGLMTNSQAFKQRLGGEVVFLIS